MTDTTATEPEQIQAEQPAPVEPEPPVSEPAAARACPECGATVADDQEWCLECGAAQVPRAAVRPPWRRLAAALGAAGVLVAGASAAAYAGLSHTSHRVPPSTVIASVQAPNTTATTPPAATAVPPPAPTAKTPPPSPAPATTSTPSTTASTATPPAAPAPHTTTTHSSTPTNSKPSTTTRHHHAARHHPTSTGTTAQTHTEPVSAAAASQYNPNSDPTTGDASGANDGNTSTTAWTATLTNGSSSDSGAGIILDLGSAKTIGMLRVYTHTPGMFVDVYGTNDPSAASRSSISDWSDSEHIGAASDGVSNGGTIGLPGNPRVRYVLVWIYGAPSGSSSNTVAVSELKLYR